MTDIETIAETLAVDFTAAVKASGKARAQAVDDITEARWCAEKKRRDGLAAIRKMREQAGELIAESIRAEEALEAAWRSDQAEIDMMMADLRGAKLGNGRKLKAIA